jgi:hypothetical protein
LRPLLHLVLLLTLLQLKLHLALLNLLLLYP